MCARCWRTSTTVKLRAPEPAAGRFATRMFCGSTILAGSLWTQIPEIINGPFDSLSRNYGDSKQDHARAATAGPYRRRHAHDNGPRLRFVGAAMISMLR